MSRRNSLRSSRTRHAKCLRIAVGADHGGFVLKSRVVKWLADQGHEVADLGTHTSKACDYPLIGCKLAMAVASGRFDRGVLVCKSGIGIAIVANKVPGVRAGVCHDVYDAERSRSHNDANVLVLGAEKLAWPAVRRFLDVWFRTPFESGGRHERRVRQIATIERRMCPPQRRSP